MSNNIDNAKASLKKEIAKLRLSCKNGKSEREKEISRQKKLYFEKAASYATAQNNAKKEINDKIDKHIKAAEKNKGIELTLAEKIRISMKSAAENMASAFDTQWECIAELDKNMDAMQNNIDQFTL